MSTPEPLVSIVIPARDAAPWLPATLDSALAQTHPAREILVVDDGSTDGTPAVLARYASLHPGRLQLHRLPGSGAAAARNHGLRHARGAYIKFLDADDLLAPESLASQLAALAARPRHLAYGAWARFHQDPATARFSPRPGWRDTDDPVDWICQTWTDAEPMYQCGLFLIPQALLRRAGAWHEDLSLIDDLEFFTRLVLASEGIVHTPPARLYYRSAVPGSLSARKTRRAWESAHLSTRLACQQLLAREDSSRTRRAAADLCQNLAHSLYPDHPDLVADLLTEVRRLGGSRLLPGGGPAFRLLARTLGWRAALRVRRLHAARRPTRSLP
jgi:glycosyltransferase involved in cell wall biosynthesis